MVRVSLEVAIGFVVQLAMCHQFLHGGEGLGAAQGGTAEELAWRGTDEGHRSGDRWPRLAWRLCLPPTPTASPPPDLALPSRDCVGGQWVRRCCARSRTLGKLRQHPGLEQGICFPEGCTEVEGVSLTLPPSTLSGVLPQRGWNDATGFLSRPLLSASPTRLSYRRAGAELAWLITVATAWRALGTQW